MCHRQPSQRTRQLAARYPISRFVSEVLERRTLLAAGGLDPSFSDDGQSTVDFGPDMVVTSDAAVVQPDGKTVVVGQAVKLNGNVGVGAGFAVARLNINGTLDTTFGPARTGTATTFFGEHPHAYAVALQADGKIVAAGVASDEFAVVRYSADGTLDRSFDGDGIKTFNFDFLGGSAVARTVLVQLDGKILVGGDAYTGLINGNTDFAFARLNSDGSFDSSFASDGKRVVGFGGSDVASAMALDYTGSPATNPRFGSIVAAGGGYNGDAHTDQLLVARLKPDGSLDNSFDGDGRIGLSYGPDFLTHGTGVVIQSDGKVVVGGNTATFRGTSASGLVLVRFLPNGAVDGSFGSSGDGWVFTDFGIYAEGSNDLVPSADGGLVLSGLDRASGGRVVLATYTANGLPDTRFPGSGKVVLPFNEGTGPGHRPRPALRPGRRPRVSRRARLRRRRQSRLRRHPQRHRLRDRADRARILRVPRGAPPLRHPRLLRRWRDGYGTVLPGAQRRLQGRGDDLHQPVFRQRDPLRRHPREPDVHGGHDDSR